MNNKSMADLGRISVLGVIFLFVFVVLVLGYYFIFVSAAPITTTLDYTHDLADGAAVLSGGSPISGFMKWDITDIPASVSINDAAVCLYIYNTANSPSGTDIRTWYINDEGWIDDSNIPVTANAMTYLNQTNSNLSGITASTWSCFNVTILLQQSYANGNKNFSFRFDDADYIAAGTNYDEQGDAISIGVTGMEGAKIYFEDKENVGSSGNYPYLNITYTSAGGDSTPNLLINFTSATPQSGNYTQNSIYTYVTAWGANNLSNFTAYLYNDSGVERTFFTGVFNSKSVTSDYNFTGLKNITYYLNATVYDILGNSNSTETRTINLNYTDDTPPAIIFAPSTTSTGTYNQTWIFANVSVTDTYFKKVTMNLYNLTGLVSSSEYTSGISFFTNNFTGMSGLPETTYYLNATALDSVGNSNSTETRTIILNQSYVAPDTTYPVFSAYWDNNGSLVENGVAEFNVSVENTNGTVFLNINGSSFNATNLSASSYRATVSLLNGTYSYNWSAYGSGYSNNLNYSANRVYTINNTPPEVPVNISIIKYLANSTVDCGSNITFIINVTNNNDYNHTDLIVNDTGPIGDAITFWDRPGDTSPSKLYFASGKSIAWTINLSAGITSQILINFTVGMMSGNNTNRVNVTNSSGANLAAGQGNYAVDGGSCGGGGPGGEGLTVNLTFPNNGYTFTLVPFALNYSVSGSPPVNCSLWSNFTGEWAQNQTRNDIGDLATGLNFTIASLADGSYLWNVKCSNGGNDSWASSNRTFSVDATTPPRITIALPENTTYTSTTSTFNVTLNENGTACLYSLDGNANISMTNKNNSDFGALNASMSQGSHNIVFSCNDTNNNWNSTTARYFFIDSINPALSLTSPANYANLTNSSVTLVFSANDANKDVCNVGFDGGATTEGTVDNSSAVINIASTGAAISVGLNNWTALLTITNISNGLHNWTVECFDLAGNSNLSDTRYFIINVTATVDSTSPYFTTIPSATNINYTQGFGVLFVASDETGLSSYNVNDSRFSINSTGWLKNASANLGAGVYNLNISINDTSNNINYTIYTVTINQAGISLGLTATTPITYGTATDFTGSGCPSQLTCSLNISNAIYGVGVIGANYSTAGNANYTANFTATSVIINQANSSINLYLNNTIGNYSADNRSSQIWINSTLLSGSGNIQIYVSGSLINNGASPLSNLTNLSLGYYNITSIYTGNTNYTSNSSTYWVNLSLYTAPDITSPYFTTIPSATNINYTQGFGVLFVASDETGLSSYNVNDSRFSINSTGWLKNASANLGAGTYSLNITISDTSNNINYTIYTVVINQASSQTGLTFDKASPQNYSTAITPTCSFISGAGSASLTNGTSGVAETLGVGTWNFNCSYLGNANYTASSNFSTFTINIINSSINLYLNNTQGNYSADNRSSQIWINSTLLSGSGNIQLYVNGSLINNGASPLSNLTNLSLGYYNITSIYTGNANYTSNSSTYWVNLTEADATPPYFTTIPSATNINYTQGFGVLFVASDETGLSSYNVNDSRFSINSTGWLKNASANLGAGTYSLNITISDTSNNINYTIYTVVINQASSQTGLTFDKASPQNYSTAITPTCSITTGGAETLSLTNGTSGVAETLGVGTWNFNCSYLGNANYTASSNFSTFIINIINSSINLYLNNTQGNYSADNRSSQIWINSTLLSGAGNMQLYLNGSLINNGASPLSNLTSLSLGYYNITSIYTGNANYTSNSSTYWVNLTEADATPPYFTTIPSATNINYTQGFGVLFVATDAIGFGSYSVNDSRFSINSTGYLRNSTSNLGVSVYNLNITINDTLDNINYTIYTVTINKATSNLTLLINGTAGNQTDIYGAQTNTSAYLGNTQQNITLLKDGVDITNLNSVFRTYGVGNYNFTAVAPATANYTALTITRWGHISKAGSSINLYLNNSRNNLTIDIGDSGTSILLNATLITGVGTIELYKNETLINSGNSPLLNSTLFNSTGWYNITTIYSATQNYTSSSETFWINATDNTIPLLTVLSPSNTSYFVQQLVKINFSANDLSSVGSLWYYNTTVNKTFSTETYLNLTNGSYAFIFYANDSYNNVANKSISFTIKELVASQAILNESSVTIGENTTEIILPANQSLSAITIPSSRAETETITLNLGQMMDSNGNMSFGENVSITRAGSSANYSVAIPSNVVINGGSDWNGEFKLPTLTSTSGLSAPSISGATTTLEKILVVGSSVELNFSNPVKLVIGAMAGKKAAWARDSTFTDIIIYCNNNESAPTNINSSARECYTNDSTNTDLIIWTYHFTSFATYTATTTSSGSSTATGGGAGQGWAASSHIYTIAQDKLEAGYIQDLKKDDIIKFPVNGITHSLKLIVVGSGSVTLEISSITQTVILAIEEEKKVDVDADGNYDVSVKLESITAGVAKITLSKAIGVVPNATSETGNQTNTGTGASLGTGGAGTGSQAGTTNWWSSSRNKLLVVLGIILAVLLFLIWYFGYRKKR